MKFVKFFLFTMFIGLALVSSAPTNAKDIMDEEELNAIHFPIKDWNQNLLQIIDVGPSVLSRDEELVLQPYPQNSSETTKKELEYLLHIAKTERSEENLKRIVYEDSGVRVYTIFENEGLIPSENYKTIKFLNMVDNDFLYFTLALKQHFQRPRPTQLAVPVTGTELTRVIPVPGHAAYPSGHAGQTYMVALVLSEIDPENAEIYKQFSVDVAHRREIAGVHYPSDSDAGRQLAKDVFAIFKKVPTFNKKLEDVKATFVKPDAKVIESVKAYKRLYE